MSELLLKYRDYNLTAKKQPKNKEYSYNFYQRYLLSNVTLKQTTINGYRVCLNQFNIWLKSKGIKNPDKNDINLYVSDLINKNLTTGTINQYIKAVRHLFKWLNSEGLYPNIAETIKCLRDTKKVKKDALSEQELIKIYNDIDTSTITGKRDKALFLLIVTGGLRISEIVNIDIKDIDIKNDYYRVLIKGKGHTEKDDYIKIIEPVYDAIQDYLNARGVKDKKEPLFISTSNRTKNLPISEQRITRESLSQVIKKRFRYSGFDSDKISAHSLRHSTATLLLKATDNDIYKVQHHLRHQDPKTTEVYININNKEQDTSEQDIYNQIFNTDKQKTINEVKYKLNNLSEQDLQDVLNIINSRIGGLTND